MENSIVDITRVNENEKILKMVDLDVSKVDLSIELAHALNAVLGWPIPQGTVANYCLPEWLKNKAVKALERFCKEHS